MKLAIVAVAALGILVSACDSAKKDGESGAFASRYQPLESEATLLRGATVLTGTGERFDDADVLMRDGRIVAVSASLNEEGATVVDATGRWITPGIIDTHSHLGVYPSPGVQSHQDGNEITGPVTAEVWAEHAVWPPRPRIHHGPGRRRDIAADPAGLGQPVRRPQCHTEEHPWPRRAGDEIPGRSAWPEDGLR